MKQPLIEIITHYQSPAMVLFPESMSPRQHEQRELYPPSAPHPNNGIDSFAH